MTTLVPLQPGAVAASSSAEDELRQQARELFGAFRSVFHASSLRKRAVFWVEKRREFLVLRHVTDLARTEKNQDHMIGRTTDDLAAVRILIGNFASQYGLSTVRWEIYDDFPLTSMIDKGRFDHADLIGDLLPEDREALAAQGIAPNGLWDFDNIFLTHVCPRCRQVFDRKFLIYNPFQPCERCEYIPTRDDGKKVMQEILRRYRKESARLVIHATTDDQGFPLVNFADPTVNGFAFWNMAQMDWLRLLQEPEHVFDGFGKAPRQMLSESLLSLLRVEFLRTKLHEYLQRIGQDQNDLDDWELFTGVAKGLGEVLVTPHPTPQQLQDFELRRKVMVDVLPRRLNELVKVAHRWTLERHIFN